MKIGNLKSYLFFLSINYNNSKNDYISLILIFVRTKFKNNIIRIK